MLLSEFCDNVATKAVSKLVPTKYGMKYKQTAKRRAQKRDSYYKHREARITQQNKYATAKSKDKRESQAGRPCPVLCESCGSPSDRRLCWDHNHETGTFRGWLCARCNMVLGKVNDNIEVLQNLIEYLKKN